MLLPVQVTFRNTEGQARLEQLVQKEAAKLEQFYGRITSCRVIVERPQRAQSSKLYHVRIDLGVPNSELVVKHMPTLHGTFEDLQLEKSREEPESVLVHKTPERAIHEAFHEMRRRLQDYARKQEGFVKATHKMEEGVVKELFPQAGYGFLETADDRRIYFHRASVLHGHFNRLCVGSRVRFTEESGEKGPQASTLRVIRSRKRTQTPNSAEI